MALLYRWAGKTFFLGIFAAFVAVVLGSSNAPLLRDYPDWVYQGALLAKTVTGHPVAGYALKHYPVPNSITTVGIALLTLAFGWVAAAKLWLGAYLALAAGTSLFAVATFGSRQALWWALPAMLFLGQGFWFGTISFNLGLCLLLVLACLLYRREDRAWQIGGIVLLCFFMHLIVYAAAGMMVLLAGMQQQRWRPVCISLGTLPLPIWYFAGRTLSHSNETQFGYSPSSHLAGAVLAAAVCLAVAWARPRSGLSRLLAPWLLGLWTVVVLAALLSTAIPAARLTARFESAVFLLRLKALVPFQLFGFVNIVYEPQSRPLRSGTLALLHPPLFFGLMGLSMVLGAAMLGALVRGLWVNRAAKDDQDEAGFLWDFGTLFALLYFVCPPNALGVISIDMRMAQLALAPTLFLFARNPSHIWRFMTLPLVLLAGVSLYQLAASQRAVYLPTRAVPLPPLLGGFAAVDPTSIADEYDRLRTGKLEGFIWTTGLFNQTGPWRHDQTSGR